MAQKYEVGLYRSMSASKKALDIVAPLLRKNDVYTQSPYSKEPSDPPRRIIVVGGEGINRIRFQDLYDKGEVRPVGIVGGGTQNVLHRELMDLKRTMTLEEFMETPWDRFPINTFFKPGQVGGAIFNNQYGLGVWERANGRENAMLRRSNETEDETRKRVRRARYHAFLFRSILRISDRFDMYSVTPHTGGVNAFPEQDITSDEVTRAWIEGNPIEQVVKLAITLNTFRKGDIPPESILRREKAKSFNVTIGSRKHDTAWIDGDTVPNPASGEAVIARANVAIPVVAIVK